ncbi:MAG: methyltransferase type 12 [Flavobacteriales bacterium]|nr:MAG: methyltransferase type 12 [Flavobacteriales bacterium]
MSDNNFSFKEVDVEGHETLDAISDADNFNEWMYDTISPYCSGKILEIGSGIGNISRYFLENKRNITLSDIRDEYCNKLRANFNEHNPEVVNVNIADADFDTKYSHLIGQFDTVFSLNVVEHIEDDLLAIKNIKKLLRKGGIIITLVPAWNTLYNEFDKSLEHYRRYNASSLNTLLKNEYEIVHTQYFNLMGIFGWILTGSIMKKKTIPKGQMGLYNKLVPIFKIIDKIVFHKIGLSVISIGRKSSSEN